MTNLLKNFHFLKYIVVIKEIKITEAQIAKFETRRYDFRCSENSSKISDPVTCARYFDHRINKLLYGILLKGHGPFCKY